jgi:hypothetical protein
MSPILSARGGLSANAYGWGAASVAGAAFESIATATGTGSSAVITFSSLGSGYKHLQLRGRFIGTSAGGSVEISVNSTGGTSYARHYMRGNGSGSVSAAGVASTSIAANMFPNGMYNTSTPCVAIIDILDAFSTTKNKTLRILEGQENGSAGMIVIESGLFISTNALTSITFTSSSGNFATTTQIGLYGIKEA